MWEIGSIAGSVVRSPNTLAPPFEDSSTRVESPAAETVAALLIEYNCPIVSPSIRHRSLRRFRSLKITSYKSSIKMTTSS